MPPRNSWRVGRHLIVDDIDGRARYDNEIAESYDGLLTRARGRHEELVPHPQDNVRVPPPELPPRRVRSPAATSAESVLDVDVVLGVVLPRGAAAHLYSNSFTGVGEMQIASGSADAPVSGDAFVVR